MNAYQNDISGLRKLATERYENIFPVYKVGKSYVYNLLRNVVVPDDLDSSVIDTKQVYGKLPWTTLSHQIYGDMTLWWLIWILNKEAGVFFCDPNKEIRFIKPEFINTVLESIHSQLQ